MAIQLVIPAIKFQMEIGKPTAFNGKCLVIAQSGKTPGTIKFKATSKGLWEGGTDIITIDPHQPINKKNDPYIFSKLNIHSTAKPDGKILGR